MARRRNRGKKPVSLAGPKGKVTLADLGLKTAAAQEGAVVEEVPMHNEKGEKVNPNGVRRARRRCWIETYYEQGKLSTRQFNAGYALLLAFEGTQRRPPAIPGVQVDTFAKPDQSVAIMIDRISNYHRVARNVDPAGRLLIDHVVINNRPISALPSANGRRVAVYMERFAAALDRLADRAGM